MLHIHRAERADGLVEMLGRVLSAPLEDPMDSEVIAVPTRGIERWLTQRLSGRLGVSPGRSDGVCANVEFPFPATLVGRAAAAAAGIDGRVDPWLPERAVWPLLTIVEQCLAEPWMAPLAAHLGGTAPEPDPARGARRFPILRHVADLFDRYGVHRPEMLQAWARRENSDGLGRPLPEDARWQAELWRHLRERIATPSPAERLETACSRLRADPSVVDLPPRFSLFGLTRLPPIHLQILEALADCRQVHLFLLHPSPVLWDRLAREAEDRPPGDGIAEIPRHPLLASWGRDSREMQLVLLTGRGPVPGEHHPLRERQDTLLHRIQADVREDRQPPGETLPGDEDTRMILDPDDRSVQVHACHGRARQVEVLRDAILQLLAEDPGLEPRDIVVMCPDVEAFAPLVQATFGAREIDVDDVGSGALTPSAPSVPGREHLPADLRVRLADRSLRQTNPVLGVVSQLLDLVTTRLTAPQVLDLAGREPVRRRFGFADDDLARIEEWVAATGIRWGLDGPHRAPYGLGALDANTWRAGLDRVLLGVAMSEDDNRLFGGVLPYDDVESGAVDLAGRLAEFVDRLQRCVVALAGPLPLSAWVVEIAAAAEALTSVSGPDAWQKAQLRRILDDVLDEAGVGEETPGGAVTLRLPEVRALLADRLRGRPTRANFRTGHLTVCTLVPMRSVPHKVVCLLGLDDGVFPRRTGQDGDDLVLAEPRIGDPDPRSEDRQLLLDALLAATDTLVVTYAARDERTNAPRPPAVPIGELLDLVDRTARLDDPDRGHKLRGHPAREAVVVHHPLQPFDVRNFSVGTLAPGRVWSFDDVALAGARALCGPRSATPPFLTGPLPAVPSEPVELDQLVRFLAHPVRAFLRQRLGVSLGTSADELAEALPIELDPLEHWALGQRLLEARLAGADPRSSAAAEVARGPLPPGALAGPVLERVGRVVEDLAREAGALVPVSGASRPIDVHLLLPGGRLVVGTVPDVGDGVLRSVTFSRVGPRHRLASWVRFLAVCAARPDDRFEAVTLGRARPGRGRAFVTVARLTLPGDGLLDGSDLGRQFAVDHLIGLVDLYDRGMNQAPPLYCKTSAAYAEAAAVGRDPRAAARLAWETTHNFASEDRDLEHQLVHGGVLSIAELLSETPDSDETGKGWNPEETSRVGRYSRRLWDPLLSVERITDR